MDKAFTLTLGAPAAILIEREIRRRETIELGKLLLAHQFSDIVIDFQIGNGIGTGTLPYRILVHIFHGRHPVDVAGQSPECSGKRTGLIDMAIQRRIQNIPY